MKWVIKEKKYPAPGTKKTERCFAIFPTSLWDNVCENPKKMIWLEWYYQDIEYQYYPYSCSLNNPYAWFIQRKYQNKQESPTLT